MGDCIEVGGECDPANFGGSKSESLNAKNAKERKERKERKEIRTNAAEIFFAPLADCLGALCGNLLDLESAQLAAAGRRIQASKSAPRPFSPVRNTDSSSMARKIVSSPKDAVRMSTRC